MTSDDWQEDVAGAYEARRTLLFEAPQHLKERLDAVRRVIADSPPRPPQATTLVLISVGGQREWVALSAEVNIGSNAASDIVLSSDFVSRAHCRLTPQNDTWLLTDLGSRNGTYVNDDPVEEILLRSGDLIQIGDATLVFIHNATDEITDSTTDGGADKTDI